MSPENIVIFQIMQISMPEKSYRKWDVQRVVVWLMRKNKLAETEKGWPEKEQREYVVLDTKKRKYFGEKAVINHLTCFYKNVSCANG